MGWGGGLTQNSVSPVPKKDLALVLLGFDWGLLGTWGLGLGLGLDNSIRVEQTGNMSTLQAIIQLVVDGYKLDIKFDLFCTFTVYMKSEK